MRRRLVLCCSRSVCGGAGNVVVTVIPIRRRLLHHAQIFLQTVLCAELQLRTVGSVERAPDQDLLSAGIPPPAVRRLRQALAAKRRRGERRARSESRTARGTAMLGRKRDASSAIRPGPSSSFSQGPSSPGGSSTFDDAAPVSESIIPFEQIKLMERLGEGTFAVVKRAFWNRPGGQKVDVAVKILRDASPLVMEELQLEAENVRRLQHPNLIRLYGVVENPAMMVFELCVGGSLLERLRDREKPILYVHQLLEYCKQMCKGMTYLETKHCVHRDLAARNMLLSADEKTIKICDFGLMRCLEENERLYVMSPQKKVPFAWCPPEALRHRQFSHASDVWSMGVAMWEIFTYGEEPWCGCKGIDVLKKVEAGERLDKPQKCSQQIYDLMMLCWKLNPDHRPKFNLLRGFLNQAEMARGVAREAHDSNEDGHLYVQKNDELILIENTGVLWFGQSVRTRLFGSFPRSTVFVKSGATQERREEAPRGIAGIKGTPRKSPHISLPIKGSFIHAAHGDISGEGWGKANVIDDIYLKNPVLGTPLVAIGASSMTPPSIVALPPGRPPIAVKPSSLAFNSDPFSGFDEDDITPSRAGMETPGPSTSFAPSFLPPSSIAIGSGARAPVPPAHTYYEPPETGRGQANGMRAGGGIGGAPVTGAGLGAGSMGRDASFLSSSPGIPLLGMAGMGMNGGNRLPVVTAAVPRPNVNGKGGPGPSTSTARNSNNTPPPVNAAPYVLQPQKAPLPSRSNGNSPAPGQMAAASTGAGSSVMDELAARLRTGTGASTTAHHHHHSPSPSRVPDPVTWRPAPQETPLLNHSQMNTYKGGNMMYGTGGVLDPFQVSDAIRALASGSGQTTSRSEGGAGQFYGGGHGGSPKPDHTITPQQPFRPQSAVQLPYPTPTQQQQLAYQQQVRLSQPIPALIPTPAPTRPPPQQHQHQQQAQPVFGARPPMNPSPSSPSPGIPVLQPSPAIQNQQRAAAAAAAIAAQRAAATPSSRIIPGTAPPSSNANSSASAGVAMRGEAGQRAAVAHARESTTSVAAVVTATPSTSASGGAPKTAERQSAIIEEINSLLPAPSALFYSPSNPPSSRASPALNPSQINPSTSNAGREGERSVPHGLSSSTPSSSTGLAAMGIEKAPPSSITHSPSAIPSTSNAPAAPRPMAAPIGSAVLQPTRLHNGSPPPAYAASGTAALPSALAAALSSSSSTQLQQQLARPAGLGAQSSQQMPLFALSNSNRTPTSMYGGGMGNGYGVSYGGSYGGGYGMGYGSSGYGTPPLAYGGYGSYSSMYPSLMSTMGGVGFFGQPAIAPAPVTLQPLGPLERSDFTVPEGASRDDVIRLLDPLTTSSQQQHGSTDSSRSSSPGRKLAEMESLYQDASFADRSRCDWMVAKCAGRVDVALRELKKEYMVDTGIAGSSAQAEAALITSQWNLNEAANAILSGAV